MSSRLGSILEDWAPELLKGFNAMQYKLPKSHPSWGEIARLCAIVEMSRKFKFATPTAPGETAGAYYAHWMMIDWWRHVHAPVYCLGLDLMRQFEETDVDNLPSLVPSDWSPALEVFMLVPPSNSIMFVKGEVAVYVLVALKGEDQTPGCIGRGIAISVMTNTGRPLHWKIALDNWDLSLDLDRLVDETRDAIIASTPALKRVVSIALQAGLSLSYLPELVEDGAEEAQGFRPRKAAAEKSNVRYPRWIGKNFTRQKRNPSVNPTPSGITVATHWRRGHWRQQVCGEKWQQRKLQWIQPTLINP